MPKIRYMKNYDGAQQWYKDDPNLCWASLVGWYVTPEITTIEDVGLCNLSGYCGKVDFYNAAMNAIFSQQLRNNDSEEKVIK